MPIGIWVLWERYLGKVIGKDGEYLLIEFSAGFKSRLLPEDVKPV